VLKERLKGRLKGSKGNVKENENFWGFGYIASVDQGERSDSGGFQNQLFKGDAR
jgi:hypothetical protein